MRYLIAFIVPPLAIAMCKRWGHFVINIIFWIASFPLMLFMGVGFIVWLLCAAHALAVCRMSSIDKRVNKLVDAIKEQSSGQPANLR